MILFLLSGILSAFFAIILEGVVAAIPSFFVQSVSLGETPPTMLLLACFAIIEETIKFFIFQRIAKRKSVNVLFPVSALLFGAGFGVVEISLAASRFPNIPSSALAGILVIHLATVLLYGYGFKKHFLRSKPGGLLLLGILLHFAYNILLA